MEQSEKNQTLRGWYKSLKREPAPKQKFTRTVAERCGVAVYTVELWISGRSKPSMPEYYDILSEESGIPKDQLFAQ